MYAAITLDLTEKISLKSKDPWNLRKISGNQSSLISFLSFYSVTPNKYIILKSIHSITHIVFIKD